MGWEIDFRKIDVELDKLRRTLEMPKEASNVVFDPEEATEEEIKAMEKLKIANQSVN